MSKGLGGEVGVSEINTQSDGRDDVVGDSVECTAVGEADDMMDIRSSGYGVS